MGREITIAAFAILLAGCSMANGISKNEAEEIALRQAAADGYRSPELWTRFDEETSLVYQYSTTLDKDVEAWAISIEAEGNLSLKNTPTAIYFISKEEGVVVDSIQGMDPS